MTQSSDGESRGSGGTFEVHRVAAFAEGVLEGNPAGVVLCPAFPEAAVMQAVAADVGFSETAFVVPHPSDASSFAIRFFTPTTEVVLCGHATLASAFVIAGVDDRATGGADSPVFHFHAREDTIETRVSGGKGRRRIRMRFPSDPPGEAIPPREGRPLLADLGLRAAISLRRTRFDLLVELESERQVTHYQAGFANLAAIDARGIIVTAPADPGGQYDFASRFFAPRCGIAEDPVTGSAHAALGPFWARRLGRRDLRGYQASDRGGLVHVEIGDDSAHLWIGGTACLLR